MIEHEEVLKKLVNDALSLQYFKRGMDCNQVKFGLANIFASLKRALSFFVVCIITDVMQGGKKMGAEAGKRTIGKKTLQCHYQGWPEETAAMKD